MTTEIKELSLPLPYTPHTTAHIHLTRHQTCSTVFLTSSTPGDAAGSIKPMGSFVYAMPDRMNSKNVLSTTIYSSPGSVEYTARIAKILARRMQTPVYVGGSIEPATMGVMAEEEIEGVKRIVEVVVRGWEGMKI
ncbi:hypothetical protein BO83DRAFT_374558 [Aspergillus eucalypticola CBS 122712]|uniref:Uncharacterized protein n=1 Tax=Aspergillus eucalypticola (strain CBS 122712 / IBT 29274) TaxID=1448314 RepID=A0A317WG01_ASPEC|nr:uncharacterized protein BO83DRAFT_374558 [Aspergillus eucalypticola CBS 122712]PWY84172.1 hypothetical protein BO83DRAFT_374558 [Aspergillus eucalypticola CBS 122712]